jgi:hypothetical protein
MSARLEAAFEPVAGVQYLRIAYPHGAAFEGITLTDTCYTHADFGAHIQQRVNDICGGHDFLCTVSPEGAFRLRSVAAHFDCTVHSALQVFCGWGDFYWDVAQVDGVDYPTSQFQAAAPWERPHPYWRVIRHVVQSGAGRVEGTLVDVHRLLRLRIKFESDQWAGLEQFLRRYVLSGQRFAVFRSADSSLYAFESGAVNHGGRSVCVLHDVQPLRREWASGRAMVRGHLDVVARILEGY